MAKYRVSLNVVRKANGSMGRRLHSVNTGGSVSRGEVVVRVNTGAVSKRITLTNGQIKAAYRKAIEAANAKAV